jgi:hypothetical protein
MFPTRERSLIARRISGYPHLTLKIRYSQIGVIA